MKNAAVTKAFIIGLVLSTLLAVPFILDLTLTPRFFALAVCLCLCFYFLYEIHFKGVVKLDVILLSYTAYVAWSCLSIFWANTKTEAIYESAKQVLGWLVFLFTYLLLKTDFDQFVKSVLKVSMLILIASALLAALQLSKLLQFDQESFYAVTGLAGHKNLFSSFLFLNLFFLIAARFKLDDPWRSVSLICIALNCILILLLRTKAVWLALAVGSCIFLFLHFYSRIIKTEKPKLKFAVLLLSGILFVNVFFLYLFPPLIHKSIHYTAASESVQTIKLEEERLILWEKSYDLIKQRPLAGTGIGNWQIHFPDATLNQLWRAEDLNYTFQRPHNDFLWILSETGFVGLNLFLLFIASILLLLIRLLRKVKNDKSTTYSVILCCSFIAGYYCISFFDFPKERIEHLVWSNVLLGMAYFTIATKSTLKMFGTFSLQRSRTVIAFGVLIVLSFTGLMRLSGEYFTRRMMNYKSNNQFAEAVSAGESALSFVYSIDPTSVPLYWYIGNCKATFGRYAEAQADFMKAYRLNPYNRNVLNDLASSYVFTNNVLLAKKYYEEAARISPRFDDPKLNLAAMYINAKDFKTAAFWLNSLMHDSERRTNYEKIVELNK